MIRKMVSKGNLGTQQRLFLFSFRKMPEGFLPEMNIEMI